MSTTRIRIDPEEPSTFSKGRIDPAVVDATTEAEITLQERKDEAEAMANARRRTSRKSGVNASSARLT